LDKVKQVIVLRTKYPNGNGGLKTVRKGKLIAQGAHASIAWLTRKLEKHSVPKVYVTLLTEEQEEWVRDKFTKVVVYVETEEELLSLHQKCEKEKLTVNLIQDAGDTEFGGIPTYTALGIGPHLSSTLDPITGHLPLL